MKYWIVTAVLSAWACSDNDQCQDSYSTSADGSNSYTTTCEEPADSEPDSGTIIPKSGECMERFTTLYKDGQARETYERQCDDSSLDVPSTDIGQLEQTLLLSNCAIDDRFHTISVLQRPLISPWTLARDRFNQMFFEDGVSPQINLTENSIRPNQANNDITSHIVVDGFNSDDPDTTGQATCSRVFANNMRFRCALVMYRPKLEEAAAALGTTFLDVARVTALHEIGHSVCLDHLSVDSSASVTAMNSFHLVDNNRTQEQYFRYLGSERDQIRSIVLNP